MNNVEKGAVRGGVVGGIIGGVVGHNTVKFTHHTVSGQAVRGIVGGVVGGAAIGALIGYAQDQKERAEKAETAEGNQAANVLLRNELRAAYFLLGWPLQVRVEFETA